MARKRTRKRKRNTKLPPVGVVMSAEETLRIAREVLRKHGPTLIPRLRRLRSISPR